MEVEPQIASTPLWTHSQRKYSGPRKIPFPSTDRPYEESLGQLEEVKPEIQIAFILSKQNYFFFFPQEIHKICPLLVDFTQFILNHPDFLVRCCFSLHADAIFPE